MDAGRGAEAGDGTCSRVLCVDTRNPKKRRKLLPDIMLSICVLSCTAAAAAVRLCMHTLLQYNSSAVPLGVYVWQIMFVVTCAEREHAHDTEAAPPRQRRIPSSCGVCSCPECALAST